MKNDTKILIPLHICTGILIHIGLLFYSYTQVDLNLTLSRVSIWQTIQKAFQSIGYFQRPISLWIFLILLFVMLIWYVLTLFLISKKKLQTTHVWIMILSMTAICIFAYPAFSYDLFNHMFTAKTVLLYGKNPYEVTPLQFTGYESWLTFMRWTHVVSIYSPLWIGLTLIPYIFGFGYFLLILWNFKLLIALFYLMAVYYIGKILEKEDKTTALMGMAIFAFNPLVIIESLISAHNDIVMMGFAVLSLYLFKEKKKIMSFFMVSMSVAVKLISIFLLPMYVFSKYKWIPLVCMSIGAVAFLWFTKREVMPWYALWILPFVALYPQKKWLLILSIGVSMGLLLRYAPFIYFGHWNDPVPVIKVWVTSVPIFISFVIMTGYAILFRKKL